MGEWQPDQTLQVKGPSRQHSVYYWVIPANVDGVWQVRLPAATGAGQYALQLEQQYQVVRGTVHAEGEDIPITNVTLTGDRLRFTVTTRAQEKMSFDGRISGNAMRGSVEVQGGAMAGRYDWTSEREAVGASSMPRR
jgi:hypothetical protein